MSNAWFSSRNSTLDSLKSYEYLCSGEPPKVGDRIRLIHVETKKIKIFKVDFVKISDDTYILKNSNNTLILKRK